MMDAFPANAPLWDMNTADFASLPDDDFLALLTKEFPLHPTGAAATFFSHQPSHDDPDGVDPQALSVLPLPAVPDGHSTPPLTDDSSPSPPADPTDAATAAAHRRRSSSFDPTDGLKRKASTDQDFGGARKNPSAEASRRASAAAQTKGLRKSTDKPSGDDNRQLRRKEQNRAAQRAFRERKEKHVKDLEDRVAALEDANQSSQSENENLRDLLDRLREENTALKQSTTMTTTSTSTTAGPTLQQTAFTFSAPLHRGRAPSSAGAGNGPPTAPGSAAVSPGDPSAPGPTGSSSPPVEIDWSALTTFDPSALNMLEEDVNMGFGGGPSSRGSGNGSGGPYRTLASNPLFMSFAEPYTAWDTTLAGMNGGPPSVPGTQPPSHQSSLDFNSFGSWTGGPVWSPAGATSLEDLFGPLAPQQSPMDLGLSPVAHQQTSSSSQGSVGPGAATSPPGPFAAFGASTASPGAPALLSPASRSSSSSSSALSSPPIASPEVAAAAPSCPRTKADFAARIASQIKSPFVQEQVRAQTAADAVAVANTIQKAAGSGMITCQGSVFPKTEKSEMNVEVLAAWRSITSNPQFKDVDINDLCAEFTNKAKCDGTKVVLDPQGVNQILDKFARAR